MNTVRGDSCSICRRLGMWLATSRRDLGQSCQHVPMLTAGPRIMETVCNHLPRFPTGQGCKSSLFRVDIMHVSKTEPDTGGESKL